MQAAKVQAPFFVQDWEAGLATPAALGVLDAHELNRHDDGKRAGFPLVFQHTQKGYCLSEQCPSLSP